MHSSTGNDSGRTQVIAASEYRRTRWKNGLGWTREIAQFPVSGDSAGDTWHWRLSLADIEHAAAFSIFTGVERELVLLRGQGLRLRFDDGEDHELISPCARLRFSGERGLHGEPLDGQVEVFNLMWRRDLVSAELLHRPLVGSMVFFAVPGTRWAIHLLGGQASFDAASGLPPMSAGDTVLLGGDAPRTRYALEGGGELLAIRLQDRGATSEIGQ